MADLGKGNTVRTHVRVDEPEQRVVIGAVVYADTGKIVEYAEVCLTVGRAVELARQLQDGAEQLLKAAPK